MYLYYVNILLIGIRMITYGQFTLAYVDSDTDILMGILELILVIARKYVRDLRCFLFLLCTSQIGNR